MILLRSMVYITGGIARHVTYPILERAAPHVATAIGAVFVTGLRAGELAIQAVEGYWDTVAMDGTESRSAD